MAMTYVCTGVEALCTVTGVQKEGLVALNEAELIAKTLDLYTSFNVCEGPCNFEIQ
jgi:hypothetical protein